MSLYLKFMDQTVFKNYGGWFGAGELIQFVTIGLLIKKLLFVDQPEENVK